MKNSQSVGLSLAIREELVASARAAAQQAYAPYSHYLVGAALLTRRGEIISGCNIENISYGLSMCAERVALFKAISEGHRDFAALALAGGTEQAALPCGACRQVLAEFCESEMPIFFARLTGGRIRRNTVGGLLPIAFDTLK